MRGRFVPPLSSTALDSCLPFSNVYLSPAMSVPSLPSYLSPFLKRKKTSLTPFVSSFAPPPLPTRARARVK